MSESESLTYNMDFIGGVLLTIIFVALMLFVLGYILAPIVMVFWVGIIVWLDPRKRKTNEIV